VALGTDGYPSDMRAECLALTKLARAHDEPAAGDSPAPAQLCARLERGRDLVRELFPLPEGAEDHVEWDPDAGSHIADRVVVGDRIVVDAGRLVHADLQEIRARAAEAVVGVRSRMEALA
jgi:hypothetical protein